jgi:hypothetical protein
MEGERELMAMRITGGMQGAQGASYVDANQTMPQGEGAPTSGNHFPSGLHCGVYLPRLTAVNTVIIGS